MAGVVDDLVETLVGTLVLLLSVLIVLAFIFLCKLHDLVFNIVHCIN